MTRCTCRHYTPRMAVVTLPVCVRASVSLFCVFTFIFHFKLLRTLSVLLVILVIMYLIWMYIRNGWWSSSLFCSYQFHLSMQSVPNLRVEFWPWQGLLDITIMWWSFSMIIGFFYLQKRLLWYNNKDNVKSALF